MAGFPIPQGYPALDAFRRFHWYLAQSTRRLTIGAPSAAYITGPNNVGTGAPRELGSNIAFGVNWVFGDTLSSMEGYVVSNPTVTPAPGAAALLGLGGLLAARRRRA